MTTISPWPHHNRVHVHVVFFLHHLLTAVLASNTATGRGVRGVFSPRMDYDEWTPLGRGDPLKNDPTYDYVPPVLDRVNYWLKPEARTPDPPPASQVLVLGIGAKKSPGKQETKKTGHADSRRDHLEPQMQRMHTASIRVAPQYIPLQGGYAVYRPPPMRPPHTMLVPPPAPATSAPAPTTAPAITTEPTTFATPDVTVSSTTNVHKVLAPMIDIDTSGQQSLSSSLLQIILHNEMATTPAPATPTSSTTLNPALTTDPLFSHYKQPAEPLTGPMYLIIQGHSKVKTYGASKLDKLSGIPIQDNNEVEEGRKSRQIDLEDFLPVEEGLESVIKDYVDNSAEGSGLKQLFAAVAS